MATRKNTKETLEKASGIDTPERFKLSSIGYSGLKMFNGVIETEMVDDLKYPKSNETFEKMMLHPSINASVALHKSMVGKATYRFLPPKDATEEQKSQTKTIEEMFGDMETTLPDVIAEAMTMLDYGFAPLEKIFRRRTKDTGSLYDDGLIGIRKLSLRHQKSISKFVFDDTGEQILGIKQDIDLISDPYNRYTNLSLKSPVIPRSKIMLFAAGDKKTNPFGTSPLRNVYLPWKYLQAIEELEASGVAKDLQGLPSFGIPPQFMAADATPEQKSFYTYAQNLVRNIQMNSQSGIVYPLMYDPETRQPMFKLELLSNEGKKNYDTTKIKEYYRMMIFIGLSSDILLAGNSETGSFALGAIKNSLTGTAVENYVRQIVAVLNNDLIRQLYELNGWDASKRCRIDYEGFEVNDTDTYGKTVQRMAAVGMLPRTLDVINSNLRSLRIDELPIETTQEELEKLLTATTSKSGAGLEEGMPSGTGSSVGTSGNSSDSNSENA